MPPKPVPTPEPTAQVALPEWLKMLTSRGVDMRVAMGLAAKIYKSHGTIEKLSSVTPQKLAGLVDDKDARKTVSNAVRGLASGQPASKKRGRDSDLLEPLNKRRRDEDDVPLDIDFYPVTDLEQLVPLTLTTNRAPVSTAWAYVISRRLGFDQSESLSIAHVYVHISSLKHALMLGNILGEQETREARMEVEELPGGEKELPAKLRRNKDDEKRRGGWRGKAKGRETVRDVASSAQPWVQLMRAKPIIERPDGTCRAIQKGEPVGPGQAYMYITRTFKDYTPHVIGAMNLVAESYGADELNRIGIHLYNEFKPDVAEWGQRGTLELAKVLDQVRTPLDSAFTGAEDFPVMAKHAITQGSPSDIVKDEVERSSEADEIATGEPFSSPPPVEHQEEAVSPKKELSVDEYEALLDAEAQDSGGGFLEGGDIYGAKYQEG
ncbi:hypothetical protein IAU60_005298 [Kwoniella sp. DSM 27419]